MKKNKLVISIIIVLLLILGAFAGYRAIFGAKAFDVDLSEQAKKISEYNDPTRFITADELKALMESDKDVLVIGTLNPKKGDTPIAGSFSCWRSDYSSTEDEYAFEGMRCSPEAMQEKLSQYGATKDTTIVVYAANKHYDATRLLWQLRNAGHKDVRILDGGLNAWLGAGYPVGNNQPERPATNYTIDSVSTDDLATFDDVINALDDPNSVIIDVRSDEEVSGQETKSGAFGPGKIAGVVHIKWEELVNEDTTFKARAEIEEIFKDYKDKNIIVYCQSGVRSSLTLLGLTEIADFKNVKNYDGSWIEYSYEHYEKNNPLAKVENGDK